MYVNALVRWNNQLFDYCVSVYLSDFTYTGNEISRKVVVVGEFSAVANCMCGLVRERISNSQGSVLNSLSFTQSLSKLCR